MFKKVLFGDYVILSNLWTPNAVDRDAVSKKKSCTWALYLTVTLRGKCGGYVGHHSARIFNINRKKQLGALGTSVWTKF